MNSTLHKSILVLSALLLAFTAWAQSHEWSQKMFHFIAPVTKIYSIDLNKSSFTEEERATLSSAIRDLNNVSHGLKFSVINFFSKKDPAVRAEYDQFKHSLSMAEKFIPIDAKQSVFYARHAIGQCAACHAKGGKATHLFELFKDTKIAEPEKGRLALAMRDYDASTQIFKNILLDASLQEDYFQTHRILVNYVNSSLLAGKKKEELITNLESILKHQQNRGTHTDLKALLADIRQAPLMNTTQEAIDAYQSFDGNPPLLERALYSALSIKKVLHQNLKDIKSAPDKSQVYKILGDIYAQFPEISIFMVPENYYELCIRTSPKTDIAGECFQKYQTKIVLGYSGSMGTHIPDYEKTKIRDLKKLTNL